MTRKKPDAVAPIITERNADANQFEQGDANDKKEMKTPIIHSPSLAT